MSDLPDRLAESLLSIPTSLGEYIDMAIQEDYMIGIFITSSAQAKEQSIGLKAGVGKSTLGCQLAHHYVWKYDSLIPDALIPNPEKYIDLTSLKAWEKLKRLMIFFAFDVYDLYDLGEKLDFIIPVILWDDITGTLGKSKSNSIALKDFAGDLLTKRRRFRILIATGSDINDLAAPLRSFFDFELIVSRRGVYEVQKRSRRKNYWDADTNIERLTYKGTNIFAKLPEHFEPWYDEWRLRNESKLKEITRDKIMSIYKFKDGEVVGEAVEELKNNGTRVNGGVVRKFDEYEDWVLGIIQRDGSISDKALKRKGIRYYSAALRLQKENLTDKAGRGGHMFISTPLTEDLSPTLLEVDS